MVALEELPRFTVAVPVRNAERTLAACIQSLRALDYPESLVEIIFVDNASSDNSKLIIKDAGFRCITEEAPGACRALAAALNRATGSYVAFTHADCVVDPQWLRSFAAEFVAGGATGLGGSTPGAEQSTLVERYCENRRLKFQNGNVEAGGGLLPWLNFVNAAVCVEAIRAVGGFDFAFRQETELDLSWRLVLAGYRLAHCPAAIVRHQYRATLSALWKQKFYIGRAAPKFVAKYGALYLALYTAPYRAPSKAAAQAGASAMQLVAALGRGKMEEAAYAVLDGFVYAAFTAGGLWERFRMLCNAEPVPSPLALPPKTLEHDDGTTLKLLNAQSGATWELDDPGRTIWNYLRAGKGQAEVVSLLTAEYPDVEESQLDRDVAEFATELSARKLS